MRRLLRATPRQWALRGALLSLLPLTANLVGWFVAPQHRGTVRPAEGAQLVALSRDGRTLVTDWREKDSRATAAYCAWDTATGQPRHTIAEGWNDLTDFLVSPDARFLAAKSPLNRDDLDSESRLKVWDLSSGDERLSLALSGWDRQSHFLFSPDERYLVLERQTRVVNQDYLEFWELASGRSRARLQCDSRRPTFAPDGKSFTVYCAPPQGGPYRLMLWALEDGEPVPRLVREYELSEQPEVSPDLRSFITTDYPDRRFQGNEWVWGQGWVSLWDMRSGALRDRVAIAAPEMRDQTGHVGGDGRLLVSEARDPEGITEFTTWEVGDGLERRASFKTHSRFYYGPFGDFSPDGRWCAERERRGAVVFETTCPERPRSLVGTGDVDVLAAASTYIGPSEPRASVTFAPDSRTLLVTGMYYAPPEARAREWLSDKTGQLGVTNYNYSPIARLWRLRDGRHIAAFPGGQHGLFSPDGRYLAVGYEDGAIRVWDLRPLGTLLGVSFGAWLALLGVLRMGRWYLARRRARLS